MRKHISMSVRLVLRDQDVKVVGSDSVARVMELEAKYRRGLISAWVHDNYVLKLANC